MTNSIVHQALHGYRRGHELIASSIRLPPRTSDLITRLSDLSGSISSGRDFTSYVTGYPLNEIPYFAIARTWEDKNAARAGCVLTHTLLIPFEIWRSVPNPMIFSELFAVPEDLRDESRFKNPLHFDCNHESTILPSSVSQVAAVNFVRKYYGEGQRPLIWVDCPDPEGAAWSIVRVLWPALREHFAWCTSSLQPRSLDSKPLDLQFVPPSAYQRFHKIPRENFILADTARAMTQSEPWCLPCANWIFFNRQLGPVDAELRAFGDGLRDDPTLMRHLFLANDLSFRVKASPTAGAGLLDVAESLAPSPMEAVEYKLRVVRSTLDAAMGMPPDESLKCLYLVGERLMNEAFLAIVDVLGNEVTKKVEGLASRHVRYALVMPERAVSLSAAAATPYFQGVVQGLSRCAIESPSGLICLQEFNKTSPHLISASPSIASGYLRGLRLVGEIDSGRDALVRWIAGLGSPIILQSLRAEVLPEIRDDLDAKIVEQLVRDLPPQEVANVLSILAESTGGFASVAVLTSLQEIIASRYPDQVRSWAISQRHWPSGVVSLVAATFSLDSLGFSQVVAFGPVDGERRTELLTAYLESCTLPRVPGWLKDSARQSIDWLVPLLSLGKKMPPALTRVLNCLLPEVREIPLASYSELRSSMMSMSEFSFWSSLVDLTLTNAVTAFVSGVLSEAVCRDWFSEDWSAKWLSEITRGELASMLIHPVHDQERRERAFRWLAIAPHTLYAREETLVIDLFWELVSERKFGWTCAMGSAWAESIRRVQNSRTGSTTLRMCADVLQYGFAHTNDLVGAAVAAAFYPVYRVVCDSQRPPHEVSDLFGIFDWDKAKELRKGLIRAFTISNWRPGDLALSACGDEQLLRKLVKRTMRQENGNTYVTAMLNDLVSRRDAAIAPTVEIVQRIAADPDFYEPWD